MSRPRTGHALAISLAGALFTTSALAQGGQQHPTASPVGDAPGVAAIPAAALPEVEDLIGRTVVGQGDERLGTVADILADPEGAARLLVIEPSPSLGIDRRVGVPIERGKVALHDDWIALSGLTRDDVAALPEATGGADGDALAPVSEGTGRWPAGLAPLPGWFAEPVPAAD